MPHEAPTPEMVQQLLSSAKTYYSVMRGNMQKWDAWYQRNYVGFISLPKNVPIHRSSRSSVIVEELAEQIRVDEPVVTAKPKGTSQKAKEQAALQAQWGREVLYRAARDALSDPLGQVKKDLVLRGAAAIKWAVKDVALGDPPEREEGEEAERYAERLRDWKAGRADEGPFIIKAVDPLLLYPSPNTAPLRYMLEVQTRRIMDVQEAYPDWTDPKRPEDGKAAEDPYREVEWAEYWSWLWSKEMEGWYGWYTVDVDGERVIEEANPYRQVPYAFRYSGLGRLDWTGDPAMLAVSPLSLVEGELIEEVRVKTAMSAQWMFHVFPRLLAKGVSAEVVVRAFQVGPGAAIEVPLQGEIKWLEVTQPNAAMMEYLSKVESMIDRKFNPSLSGQRTADYGIHQALNLGQAVKVIGPIKNSLNYMASDLLTGLGGLMELFGLGMNLSGTSDQAEKSRSIAGSDFRHRAFEVSFEAVDPSENERRMLSAFSVKRDEKTISRETFRGVWMKGVMVNNDEEEARVMAERVMDQLIEMGVLAQVVMQRLQARLQSQSLQAMAGQAVPQAEAGIGGALEQMFPREAGVEATAGQPGLMTPGVETRQAGQEQGGI